VAEQASPTIRVPEVVVAPAAVEALVAVAEAEVTPVAVEATPAAAAAIPVVEVIPVAVEAKSPNTGLAAKRAKLVERGLVRI
jgi:hypothetical protein